MTSQVIVAPQEQQNAASAWVYLMGPAMELARVIKNTDFVPRGLRGNEAAITAALLTANELGVGGMTGLANIAIIDGKPALSATLMRALVLSRGHEVWFEDLATTKVTACGRRRGSEPITRVTWTMEMARTALLLNKDNWKKYPRSMLEARSSSELCRLVFADCLAGLMHSVEELEDGIVTVETGGGDAPPENGTTRRRRAIAAPAPVPSVASVDETPAGARPPLPGDAPQPPASAPPAPEEPPAQSPVLRKLHAAFRDIDVKDRDDRIAITSLIVDRPVASSKDLSEEEVDQVVDMLMDHRNGNVRIVKGADGWRIETTTA